MKKVILILVACIFMLNTEMAFCETKQDLARSIESDLQMYAIAISEEYGTASELEYSVPISAKTEYGKDAGRVSFVFLDNKCIGYITIKELENNYITTFSLEELSVINEALKSSIGISAIVKKSGTEEAYFTFELDEDASCPIVLNQLVSNSNVASYLSNGTAHTVLNIPFESNQTINGKGVCWAACIASLAKYRGITAYNASGVYYTLQNIYNLTPSGTTLWFVRGFREILSENCITTTGNLVFTDINNLLVSDKPIIFDIFTSTGNVGHSIVCREAYRGTNSVLYSFMDPNYTVYKYVALNGTTGNLANFHYSPADSTYTEVRYYHYEG